MDLKEIWLEGVDCINLVRIAVSGTPLTKLGTIRDGEFLGQFSDLVS
jgi:hypothetical protein